MTPRLRHHNICQSKITYGKTLIAGRTSFGSAELIESEKRTSFKGQFTIFVVYLLHLYLTPLL